LSQKMRQIMSRTEIEHKFIKGIHEIDPNAQYLRKSGSWRTYHSDSVLVKRNGHAYIAVGLSNSPNGGSWLVWLIQSFDRIIMNGASSSASLH
jgi:beta-lactamase class A